jgi:hypothetical protein
VELAVQSLGEGDLLFVGERLVAEHEHRVRVHPGADLGERSGILDLAQVDRAGLGDEMGVEPPELEWHGASSSETAMGPPPASIRS